MSIRLLRTLVAVADSRTFSAAASQICVTHAAVSQQMQTLESDLGIVLFDRSKRTPELTPVAHEIVRKARQLVAEYDDLVPSVVGDDGLNGEVTFGVLPTLLTGLTPAVMVRLRTRFPELRLHIRPALTGALLADLERGRLDAAVLSKPHLLPLGIEFQELVTEPLELIVSNDISETDVTELLNTQPFIRFNRNAVVGTLIENWLTSKRIHVSETMELDSLEAIESMVQANLGISIVPKRSVRPHNSIPLKRISLGADAPVRCLGLAYHSNYPKIRVVEEIRDALRTVIDDAAKND
ncbi:MAG: LysR family transcriptional regulator [Granulosicoccus sp.]